MANKVQSIKRIAIIVCMIFINAKIWAEFIGSVKKSGLPLSYNLDFIFSFPYDKTIAFLTFIFGIYAYIQTNKSKRDEYITQELNNIILDIEDYIKIEYNNKKSMCIEDVNNLVIKLNEHHKIFSQLHEKIDEGYYKDIIEIHRKKMIKVLENECLNKISAFGLINRGNPIFEQFYQDVASSSGLVLYDNEDGFDNKPITSEMESFLKNYKNTYEKELKLFKLAKNDSNTAKEISTLSKDNIVTFLKNYGELNTHSICTLKAYVMTFNV